MSVEIMHFNNIDNFTGLSTKQRNKLEEMLQTEIAKDPILAVRSKSEPDRSSLGALVIDVEPLTWRFFRSAENEMEVRHMLDLRDKLATALSSIEVLSRIA